MRLYQPMLGALRGPNRHELYDSMPITWLTPHLLYPAAYLAGSINFSILLFKLLGKADPRSGFSGNPGATNVYRQAGWLWAAVVLLLDMGRALAVAVVSLHFQTEVTITWVGLFLIIGNRFPCFHRFKGGKGVANFLGFSLVLSPGSALLSGVVWVVVNAILKKPFIASFGMVAVLAIGTVLKFHTDAFTIAGTVLTALLIVLNHKQNIIDTFNKLSDKKAP